VEVLGRKVAGLFGLTPEDIFRPTKRPHLVAGSPIQPSPIPSDSGPASRVVVRETDPGKRRTRMAKGFITR